MDTRKKVGGATVDGALHPGPGAESGKKTYARPAILSEDVFETLALGCGKVADETFDCQFSQRS